MKKRYFYLVVASMLLAGCASTTPENLIPENFKEDLSGTYYSANGKLEVSETAVTFNEKELKPTKFVVESFEEQILDATKSVEHAVIYLKDGKDNYRTYLSGSDNYYQLVLEQKIDGDYKIIDHFMPSIESLTGAYTGYGDSHPNNVVYHVGNNFNFHRGFFDIGIKAPSYGMITDSLYIESFYTLTEDGLQVVASFKDYADGYEYGKFVAATIDGQEGLCYADSTDWLFYYYDPMFVTYPYYADENTSFASGTIDPSTLSVTIGETSYSYSISRDEKIGQVVTLVNGTNTTKAYPTQYGMVLETADSTTEFVSDSVEYLAGTYKHIDKTFSYDLNSNEVKLNGEIVDHSFAIFNHQKSIKVTTDEGELFFSPFKQNIAILVTSSTSETFYINEESYSSSYGHNFISKGYGTYDEITITPDFTVIYDGKIVDGSLIYDPKLEYPYVDFSINGETYIFSLIEASIGAAQLKTPNGETYDFFIKEKITDLYNEYTSHHETDLIINPYTIEYYGKSVDYAVSAYYYEPIFGYLMSITFNTDDKKMLAFTNTDMIAIDITNADGTIETKTFIATEQFASLVGSYYLEGTFGPEKFTLTADGHFYADTVNSTNNGLIYDVEYDYSLKMSYGLMGEAYPTIIFHATSTQSLDLIKNGDKLTLNLLTYVADYLFKFNGVYISDYGTVVELRADALYVDGKLATINSITYDEYGTYINATAGFSTYTYSFYDYGEGEIYLYTDDMLYSCYMKSDFDFDSLVGEYTSSLTTYTLSINYVPGTEIANGYALSNGFMTYTTYSIVMHDGYLSLQFNIGFDTIYIYATESGNVLEVVSAGLPPVPPPPPPPPPLF